MTNNRVNQTPVGYKQTDVGVIPNDWRVSNYGSVLKVKHGRNQKEVQASNGQYPILGSGGEIGRAKAYLYDKPSVLIGRKGTINKPQFKDKPFWTVDTLFYTEISNNFNPKYVYYKFKMIDWYSYNEASGVPSLNAGTIEKIVDCFPQSKIEQEKVASVLSDTDSLITKLSQLIQKKRHIKQGAMQDLLTGKQRLPSYSEKWKTYLLPEVTWFQEGPGVRSTQFTQSGVKLLNGTNIFRGKIDLDKTNRFISELEAFGAYQHFLADNGDIVIASSGITVEKFDEKIAFVEKKHLPLCMNTSTIRFKVGDNMIPQFLYYFLMSNEFKQQIGEQATGSAQLNFGPVHLKKVELIVPDTNEQTAIAQVLSDMEAEIKALEKQRAKYIDLKQGMMQQLLTGKIRLVQPESESNGPLK